MTYPVLLSFQYFFQQTSLLIHIVKYLFIRFLVIIIIIIIIMMKWMIVIVIAFAIIIIVLIFYRYIRCERAYKQIRKWANKASGFQSEEI